MRHLALRFTIAGLLAGLAVVPMTSASAATGLDDASMIVAAGAAPVITGVSPASGSVVGGNIVTLTGIALLNVPDSRFFVTFGGRRRLVHHERVAARRAGVPAAGRRQRHLTGCDGDAAVVIGPTSLVPA